MLSLSRKGVRSRNVCAKFSSGDVVAQHIGRLHQSQRGVIGKWAHLCQYRGFLAGDQPDVDIGMLFLKRCDEFGVVAERKFVHGKADGDRLVRIRFGESTTGACVGSGVGVGSSSLPPQATSTNVKISKNSRLCSCCHLLPISRRNDIPGIQTTLRKWSQMLFCFLLRFDHRPRDAGGGSSSLSAVGGVTDRPATVLSECRRRFFRRSRGRQSRRL